MSKVGDLRGNTLQLLDLLRSSKYLIDDDDKSELLQASPPMFLKILHFIFFQLSPLFKIELESKGYFLHNSYDLEFLKGVFRYSQQEFNYKPVLTIDQFLTEGTFAERKIIICKDIFLQVKDFDKSARKKLVECQKKQLNFHPISDSCPKDGEPIPTSIQNEMRNNKLLNSRVSHTKANINELLKSPHVLQAGNNTNLKNSTYTNEDEKYIEQDIRSINYVKKGDQFENHFHSVTYLMDNCIKKICNSLCVVETRLKKIEENIKKPQEDSSSGSESIEKIHSKPSDLDQHIQNDVQILNKNDSGLEKRHCHEDCPASGLDGGIPAGELTQSHKFLGIVSDEESQDKALKNSILGISKKLSSLKMNYS